MFDNFRLKLITSFELHKLFGTTLILEPGKFQFQFNLEIACVRLMDMCGFIEGVTSNSR